MQFCDLHNDVLSSMLGAKEIIADFNDDITFLSGFQVYLQNEMPEEVFCEYQILQTMFGIFDGLDLCLAVWGTENTGFPDWQVSKFNKLKQAVLGNASLNLRLAFEDIHYSTLKNIENIINADPVYCSITWNWDNRLGGGAYGESGLTVEGQSIVKKLFSKGIAVDLSHLNKKTFYDVLNIADGKILNSHTAFEGVCKHPRNIDKDQIKRIVESNGIIGLTFVSDFLNEASQKGKNATIDDIVLHIDYFCQEFGDDNLCFGSDFYGTKNLPSLIKNYKTYLNILAKLIKIGYNYNSLKKIFCENYKNFHSRRL